MYLNFLVLFINTLSVRNSISSTAQDRKKGANVSSYCAKKKKDQTFANVAPKGSIFTCTMIHFITVITSLEFRFVLPTVVGV